MPYYLRIITALRIILTSVCIASNIIDERFDILLDSAPTGEPYLSLAVRSQIECSTICARDTDCLVGTINTTLGSRWRECEMFTCPEGSTLSHRTGVKSFKKKGKYKNISLSLVMLK